MEKEIIFGVLGIVLGYILYKYIMFRQTQQKSANELFSDIINNDKYKVKGQYDHLK